MSNLPTRGGRPVEDPRTTDPDDHEKAEESTISSFGSFFSFELLLSILPSGTSNVPNRARE